MHVNVMGHGGTLWHVISFTERKKKRVQVGPLAFFLSICQKAKNKMANTRKKTPRNSKALKTPEIHDATAKDSFLKNAELKAITFSYIQDKNHRRWLLNAALACKDFLDVALDALWEELNSLLPLLQLLPSLQFENKAYVCAHVHTSLYDLILSLDT